MKSAYKKLGINMLLFSISSFGTKLIGFLMVPLYTNCLTTEEYGIADMLFTIVQVAVPIFSVDIADGVIRFVLERKQKGSSILFTALKVLSIGSIVLLLLMIGFRAMRFILIPDKYYGFIILNYMFTSTYNTIVSYLKGKERIKDIVFAGLMCSLLNAGGNILFLTKLNMGVDGYLFAHLLAVAVPLFYLLVCALYFGDIDFGSFVSSRELEKEMLLYSAPLILNGLAWWVNNSIDRVFVTLICGVGANGLLAVAYKIPSILSMLQTIFHQAWSLSAIQEFDSEDKNGFIGRIYSYYGCAMTISSSVIILLNVPLATILYANDFFAAWKYTGMLIIAHLFGGVSVCISGVFNAVKDTKTLAVTTMVGAIVNVALDATLIPCLGVQGAVIATMLSNLVVWVWRMRKVSAYINIKINITRDFVSYILVIIQCLTGLFLEHMYVIQVAVILLIILMYRTEIIIILKHGLNLLGLSYYQKRL